MRIKTVVKTTLKIALAVGLVAWLAQRGFLDVSTLVETTRWYHVLGGVFIGLVMLALNNWRWHVLVRHQGLALPFSRTFKLTMIGQFFNYMMPGGVGGDVVKGFYLMREPHQGRLDALMSIIMDRVIGFWAMSFMALAGLAFQWRLVGESAEVRWMAGMVAFIFTVFTLLFVLATVLSPETLQSRAARFLPDRMERLFLRLYRNMHAFSRSRGVLAQAFLLSLASQATAVLFMILAARIQGFADIPLSAYFFVIPLGFIVMAVPVAPAGVGVGQAALFFLFNRMLGHESAVGPNIMTAFQVTLFACSLFGAYFYLQYRPLIKEQLHVG